MYRVLVLAIIFVAGVVSLSSVDAQPTCSPQQPEACGKESYDFYIDMHELFSNQGLAECYRASVREVTSREIIRNGMYEDVREGPVRRGEIAFIFLALNDFKVDAAVALEFQKKFWENVTEGKQKLVKIAANGEHFIESNNKDTYQKLSFHWNALEALFKTQSANELGCIQSFDGKSGTFLSLNQYQRYYADENVRQRGQYKFHWTALDKMMLETVKEMIEIMNKYPEIFPHRLDVSL